MRARSLCAHGAFAMTLATVIGCNDGPASTGRVTLTAQDPDTGIAGQFVSPKYGTFTFRAGRDPGALGAVELRGSAGDVVIRLADRGGTSDMTLVAGDVDVSGALVGDEAAELELKAFAATPRAKALADFATAFAQTAEGAPALASYGELFRVLEDIVETADVIPRADHDFGSYSACDSCQGQCGWCYQVPDFLGGACVGCSCSSS